MEPERPDAEWVEPEKKKKNDEYYLEPEPPRRRRWPWFVLGGCLLVCCACLILPLVLFGAGSVVVSTIVESSEVTELSTTQLALEPDATDVTFRIENEVGDITITTGAAGEIAVEYRKVARGISQGQARSYLDDINVRLEERSDGTIALTTERPGGTLSFGRASEVDLTISVPDDVVFDLVVNGGVGALRVERGVRVGQIDAQLNVGDIVFNGALDESLSDSRMKVDVGALRLYVPGDLYAQIDAETGVGNVTMDATLDTTVREERRDATRQAWRGTVGSGSGTAPVIELRTSVGDIGIYAE